MAEIGSAVYIDSWNYLIPYATEVQIDTINNRSLVVYGLNLHVAGSVASSGIDVWIRSQQNYIGYASYGKGVHTLMERQEWIPHNSDGTGSINVYWAFNSAIVYREGQATLTLSKIDRLPTLISGMNFSDSQNPVYKIQAYGTYPLRVKLEAGGNNKLITRDLESKNSQTYTLVLTQEERKLLRSFSLDGKTVEVVEVVCAMDGENELNADGGRYTMTINRKTAKIKVDGSYRNVYPYVRVSGEWKEAKPYVRVNGEWKEVI